MAWCRCLLVAALAALAGEGGGAGGAGAAEGPGRRPVLRVAYPAPASSPVHRGAAHFKDAFEEAAGGRAQVELRPRGGEEDGGTVLADLRRGAVQVAILVGGGPAGAAAQVTSFPFLFRDALHRRQVAEGRAGRLLARRISEQSGATTVAFFAGQEQVLASVEGPVVRAADLRGKAIRVAPQPLVMQAFRSLGALPMPLPVPWTVPAARQRMVVGALVDLPTAQELNAHQVFPYMTHPSTAFLAELYPVLVDRRALAALPRDLQGPFAEAWQGAARRGMALAEEATDRALRDLQARGVRFAPVDASAFREAFRPFRAAAARRLRVEDLLADIAATR